MGAIAEDVIVETRVCRTCEAEKPISEYTRLSSGRKGYVLDCKPCTYKRKLERERARTVPFGPAGVNRAVEAAPDRRPAVRLRVELSRQRAAGQPFRLAWPIAVRHAVRGLTPQEAAEWRRTFSSTRVFWQASFTGLAWPAASGPSLMLPAEDVA